METIKIAYDSSGSLLALTQKLRTAEEKIFGNKNLKLNSNQNLSNLELFKSVTSKDGFSFIKNYNKKKLSSQNDGLSEEPPRKKPCLLDENILLNGSNLSESLSNSIDEDNLSFTELNTPNKSKNLENISKFEIIKKRSDKLSELLLVIKNLVNLKNNFELNNSFQKIENKNNFFWKIIANTKISADKEQCQFFEDNKNNMRLNSQTQFLKKYNSNIKHLVIEKSIDLAISNQMPKLFSTVIHKISKKISRLANTTNTQLSFSLNENDQIKFKCTQCNYKTNRKSHMIRHQGSVHSMFSPFACAICDKNFNRVEHVRSHLKTQHPERTYSNALIVRQNVDVLIKNNIDPLKTNGFIISKDSKFSSFKKKDSNIFFNMNSKITNGDSSSSNYLRLSKNMSKDINGFVHQNASNILNKISTMSNDLECHYCKKTFSDINFLEIHLKNSHSKKIITCSLCGFVLANESELNQHMTIHANDHILNKDNHKMDVQKSLTPQKIISCQQLQKVKTTPNDVITNGFNGIGNYTSESENKIDIITNGNTVGMPNDSNDEGEGEEEEEDDDEENPDAGDCNETNDMSNRKRPPRKFKMFFCPLCPGRAPFRYRKSFNKHMLQHP